MLYSLQTTFDESLEKLIYDLNIKEKNGENNNSFETTFIPLKELMDLIDIDVADYVKSQLVAFENFIKHDSESYNISKTLQLQYEILKSFKGE